MSIAELKERLHQKIEDLNDIELLGAVNELLADRPLFKIPEEFIPGIERGMRDFENNDYIALDEFEVKYQKWLRD